jgi:hypothetical protein
MDFSGAAYAKAHEGEIGKIVVAGEADFGARIVYSVQLPPAPHGCLGGLAELTAAEAGPKRRVIE